VDISPYSFFKDDDVFVLWQWSWIDNHPSISPSPIPHSNSCTPDLNLDTQASSDLDDEISAITHNDDGIPAITHTVIFKCIGAHKETEYQDQLELAKKNLKDGNSVAVKLNPEPDNRCNSKAI